MNRQELEKPFGAHQIKQREGSHGRVMDFVEGHSIIQRLNEVFESSWSFNVVEQQSTDDEIIVLATISTDGVSKSQFGSSRITRNKETDKPISLGDDFKAAATDALKKCATLFGVGLHLYDKDQSSTDQAQQGQSKPATKATQINGARISTKQHKFVLSLSRDQKATKHELNSYCKQHYGVVADHLSREQASELIDGLVNDRINLIEKSGEEAA